MKKNTVLLFSSALLITAAVLFCAAGCSQKNTATARSAQAWSNEDGADFADIPDFEQAFVPVYEKAVPEPDLPAKKRNLSGSSSASAKKSASGAAKSGATSSTVRPLKEYKTSYTTTRSAKNAFVMPAGVSGESAPAAPEKSDLTVVDWGPQKELPAAIRQPSF